MSIKDSNTGLPIEERFRAILEQSPLSIQIMSIDGRILQVNKAWEQLWGITLDQIEGYNILEDEQLVKIGVMPYLKRAFAGEYCEAPPVLYDPNETLPDITRNAEPKRWTKAVIYPIKDESGQVREVVLMHEDITAQMQVEAELRESEKQNRSLLENANDIIYSHDLQGKYLSINKAGEKITGYTREEVLGGMNIAQVVVPEHLEMAKIMSAQKLVDPTPTVYEVDIFAKDGRRLTLEVSTRISFDENNQPVAVEGVARDITERKQVEKERLELAERVEKQRKYLQEMVSSVPGVVWEAWGEPNAGTQHIDFVSDYVETMLGYTVEEWLSTPNFWLTIVHPEDRESAIKSAAATFSSGVKGTNQFRWIAKDGKAVWVESQSVAIFDDAGKPIGMRGVTMDISERKQKQANEQFLAEASVALSTSLDYKTTLSTVARLAVPHFADWCAVDIVNQEGTLRRLEVAHTDSEKVKWAHKVYERYPPNRNASQGSYKVLLTGQSEFYPDIPDELLVSSARDEEHLEILRQIGFRSVMLVPLKTRKRTLGVLSFGNTQSSRRHTAEDLMLAEDLAQRAGMAIDNAELYQAEKRNRKAVQRTSKLLLRLQTVSSSLSQALTPQQVASAVVKQGVNSLGAYAGTVALLTDDTTELEIVESIGFPEDVLGKWKRFSLNQTVPIADAVRYKKPVIIESFAEHKEKYPLLGPLASVTGSKALVALPLMVEGQTIGALGLSFLKQQSFSANDRAFMIALAHQCAQALDRARLYETEQRLREQAEAANRMKDEFLATVSHELRTPLNAIVGWASILKNNKTDAETALRAVETIDRNARVQTQIIEDLLDVSRITTGKVNLNPQFVELDSIIKTALEGLLPSAEQKGVRVESEFKVEKPALVWGDSVRLQQILWNLLSNAVKFTGSGGEIRVTLEKVESNFQLVVKDNGQGIRPEFLPFIFERFRQADGTSTRKAGGLGLGLAIVRYLVEMHGGIIRAESAGDGQGAAFTVTLPIAETQENKPLPENLRLPENGNGTANDSLTDLKNVRILIVDDEADARLLLTMIVEGCGALAFAADSVSQGIKAIKSFKPHILISDIGMPEEDGYSLIREVRSMGIESDALPAVALTAYAGEEDVNQALNAGFQIHIPKPVDSEELIRVIAKLTKQAETRA